MSIGHKIALDFSRREDSRHRMRLFDMFEILEKSFKTFYQNIHVHTHSQTCNLEVTFGANKRGVLQNV